MKNTAINTVQMIFRRFSLSPADEIVHHRGDGVGDRQASDTEYEKTLGTDPAV